jgi:SAM-dependent methyltransferase
MTLGASCRPGNAKASADAVLRRGWPRGESLSMYDFIDDTHVECGNMKFVLDWTDFTRRTSATEVVILKPRKWVESYADLILNHRVKRVLELGVWQGGMAMFLPLLSDEIEYVGVDQSAPIEGIEAIRTSNPRIAAKTRFLFRTGQDEATLPTTVSQLFGGQPLDLIMDDASHLYAPTKRAFENLFGLLKPGGRYVIEDWGWAHWPGYVVPEGWRATLAPSTLLFELTMLCASTQGIIDQIEVERGKYVVLRGSGRIPEAWSIDSAINMNGFVFEPVKFGPG